MTISTKGTVMWRGEQYFGGEKIGLTEEGHFVIDLWTTPAPAPRGSYFTCIPISPTAYRRQHKTKCGVRDDGDSITVFCDWGSPHKISAERVVMDAILKECEAADIPLVAK